MREVIKEIDTRQWDRYVESWRVRKNRESVKAMRIEKSDSFRFIGLVRKYMDEWFLDPVIGAFLPGFGDTLTTICAVPGLYIAACKVKSFRLTAAILTAIITDWLIGLTPGVGDILDALYRSNSITYRLISGWTAGDKATVREVNIRAFVLWALLLLLAAVIYLICTSVISLWGWMYSLFT